MASDRAIAETRFLIWSVPPQVATAGIGGGLARRRQLIWLQLAMAMAMASREG